MGIIYDKRVLLPVRRNLRREMTLPEQIFWGRVRARQLHSLRFRRQESIGQYIVDFYCAKAQLVIEIDGDSHFTEDGQRYDKVRTDYLTGAGLRVVRFTNMEVMKNIAGIIERIEELIEVGKSERERSKRQRGVGEPPLTPPR